jgi:hypothetical protein
MASYIAGRMFFIVPANQKKKPDSGRMFFIVPEPVHSPMGF